MNLTDIFCSIIYSFRFERKGRRFFAAINKMPSLRASFIFFVLFSQLFGEVIIRINEINLHNSPATKEFVELSAVSTDGSDIANINLESIEIYGISYDTRNRKYKIDLIIDCDGMRTNQLGLFSAGGSDSNADLQVPNEKIQYEKRTNRLVMHIMINPKRSLSAVILTKNIRKKYNLAAGPQFLTEIVKKDLRDSRIDMIVFGKSPPKESEAHKLDPYSDIFEDIIWRDEYIIQEYDTMQGSTFVDRSMNRCGLETDPFRPQDFKVGKPTVSAANDCSSYKFLLRRMIEHVSNPLPNAIFDESDAMDCSWSEDAMDCDTLSDPKLDSFLSDRDVRASLDTCSQTFPDIGGREMVIEMDQSRRESMSGTEIEEQSWRSRDKFDLNWISLVKQHQEHLLSSKLLEDTTVQSWFNYKYDTDHPEKSTFNCWICHDLYDKFKLHPGSRPKLTNFMIENTKKYNNKLIKSHYSSPSHSHVLTLMQEAKIGTSSAEFLETNAELDKRMDGSYYATANIFRIVYTEVRTNVASLNHRLWVDLVRMTGSKVGYIHDTSKAAVKIVKSISKQMHYKLLSFMKSSSEPFSLIMDGSTDSGQTHHMIIYIQTIEDDRPVIHFYRLIQLSKDETSQGIFDSIRDKLKEDALECVFNTNFIGFGSDGASVMRGVNNGLEKKFRDKYNHRLFSIHCMAHRLNLVTTRALRDRFPTFKAMEKFLSKVYSFYSGTSHKRLDHLKESAAEIEEEYYKIKYIHQIRWVSGSDSAVDRLIKLWKTLHHDLVEISQDTSFSLSAERRRPQHLNSFHLKRIPR